MATTSTMWIKNNMLFSDKYERQLTEAELKVQRSIQKLSIPDWYLNKRTSPPKILNNIPIESRLPSWKNSSWKNCTLNSTSSTISVKDTLPRPQLSLDSKTADTGTYKICRQQKSGRKSPTKITEKLMDTNLPEIKLKKDISKTFPKVSPSRKIQNINLVFSRGPAATGPGVRKADAADDRSKYDTFVVKKSPEAKKRPVSEEYQGTPKKTPRKNFLQQCREYTPSTPDGNVDFKVRATSTPKFSPVNLFSSTIIEKTPKSRKISSQNILEKLSFFESSGFDKTLNDSKNLTRSSGFSVSETSRGSLEGSTTFLERNIWSIDPIIFEADRTHCPSPVKMPRVREMVREISERQDVETPVKKSSLEWRRSKVREEEPKLSQEKKQPQASKRTNANAEKTSPVTERKTDADSPSTRFLNSRRKSVELEKVVRSKQPARDRSVVKDIIEALAERVSKPSSQQRQAGGPFSVHQNFVRKVVDALERGNARSRHVLEEDSSSESDAKSLATSMSLKDTDSSSSSSSSSNSDSDQRSPLLGSDDAHETFEYSSTASSKLEEKSSQDEDSVYWIPVSRCKLPRTSSLLSMMSRLSTNPQSPCVSPIRSESEPENTLPWGTTFKKMPALSRKLFRIDETTVIDSGYSDKSGIASSMTDSTWSEDTQNESEGSEASTLKIKRSVRRKSIVGTTFRVQ